MIAMLCVIAVFSGFNLDNRCNIWIFGKIFNNVPIFLTVLLSFAAGIIVSLPAIFLRKEKKLTVEQARALAERLEQEQKKQLEKQLSRQKKLQEAKEKAQRVFNKEAALPKKEAEPKKEEDSKTSKQEKK